MAKTLGCGGSCFLKRMGCAKVRACACNCEAWFGMNKVLINACISACQYPPRPLSREDFICQYLGAEAYYNQVGALPPCNDFDPLEDTAQGQAYTSQQEDIEESETASKTLQNNLLIGAGLTLLLLVLVFIFS